MFEHLQAEHADQYRAFAAAQQAANQPRPTNRVTPTTTTVNPVQLPHGTIYPGWNIPISPDTRDSSVQSFLGNVEDFNMEEDLRSVNGEEA